MPVLALSPRPETVRRAEPAVRRRVRAYDEEGDTLDELLASCAERAKQEGLAKSGDLIGITAGLQDQGLGTNLFEVHRVP